MSRAHCDIAARAKTYGPPRGWQQTGCHVTPRIDHVTAIIELWILFENFQTAETERLERRGGETFRSIRDYDLTWVGNYMP